MEPSKLTTENIIGDDCVYRRQNVR